MNQILSNCTFVISTASVIRIRLMRTVSQGWCHRGSACMSRTGCALLSEISKSSHRLARWLCVCQPTCPAFAASISPSIHSPPASPSAKSLIDQLCPGRCPLISQLDVFCVWVKWINYWANRTGSGGGTRAGASPLNARVEQLGMHHYIHFGQYPAMLEINC